MTLTDENDIKIFEMLLSFRPHCNVNFLWNDIGRGNLFGACFQHIERFCVDNQKWYIYNNGVWEIDKGDIKSQGNMQKLLHELEGKENRKAQFRTAICLILNGEEHLFEGIVKGEIIEEKRGGAGFGYDPIFVPEGYELTFAELGNDIKNTISHRARAVEKLCQFLKK